MRYTLIIEDRNGIIADEVNFDQGTFTLGRVEDNDIQLPSGSVSRHHARVFTESGRCYVADLNSSNGVWVDGHRIVGSVELIAGSQVRVGDYLILLRTRDENSAARPQHVAEALMYPRLIRIGDVMEGESFSLTQNECTIGRTDDNFILLADPSVSRRHATIVLNDQRYVLMDMGSSNGTRVNDHPVSEPVLISGGDLLRFGNVRFVFAAPGQHVDLRDYHRYLRGSSKGLVVAVTVLALLLVLVASGIGAFVLIDNNREETPEHVAPQTPTDRARALKNAGDELIADRDNPRWAEAISNYQLATQSDPNYMPAQDALRMAQAEFEATRNIQEARMTIGQAQRLSDVGTVSQAIDLFESARERLLGIPASSRYFESARAQVQAQVDPTLLTLYSDSAQAAVDSSDYDLAITRFDSLRRVLDEQPNSGSGSDDEIRTQLWRNLIAAGNSASDAERFAQAVALYERAESMGELPSEVSRRLRRAREQL
ncbi:MAG: FHA domain-containing protein [Myxococcales bacterium]|nr:FHA domain-containing protein [Myxococcales bacterium]